MADINLLPQEKKEGIGIKFGNTTKKIFRISLIFLGLVVLIYAGAYLYFFVREQLVTGSANQLEIQIKALEPTEQKIVLIRDRLTKTSKILSSPSIKDEAEFVSVISENLPEGVLIRDVKITPEDVTVVISADESKQVTEILRSLIQRGNLSKIELKSLSFSSKDRYLFEIKTVNLPAQN